MCLGLAMIYLLSRHQTGLLVDAGKWHLPACSLRSAGLLVSVCPELLSNLLSGQERMCKTALPDLCALRQARLHQRL